MTENAIKALVQAQTEMNPAKKGSENPHFKKKYADLAAVMEACIPALHKNGFAVMQPVLRDGAETVVATVFLHESGEKFECWVPLIVDKQNMMGMKSAVTYARRIGLENLAGIASIDDDAIAAADHPPKQERAASGPTPEAIAKCIETMRNIWGDVELGGYWRSLPAEQPGMQSAPGVRAAKDAQRKSISEMIGDGGVGT